MNTIQPPEIESTLKKIGCPPDHSLKHIGQGFCGTVWASAPTERIRAWAIKREDGGPGRSLYNDFIMHQRVFRCLTATKIKITVPCCHQYISSDNQFTWNLIIPGFPSEFQVPCNAMITDRIPAFPTVVREKIIDLYCTETVKSSAKSDEANQACLIRPYLGRRRRRATQPRIKCFSLRNYPLHVDQIEQLGLDTNLYAMIMAETLAHLYWKARVDANDVEFVLAPPIDKSSDDIERHLATQATIQSRTLGEHVVWILDFDCCREMSFDKAGVEQAVTAFKRNDPFFPRPGRENSGDRILWTKFKDHFLQTSEAILGKESPERSLPLLWINLVEKDSGDHQLAHDV